ncbi:MAG TPA: NADH-quinone oxidoreductase subunit M [Polyangium sp.]|nr:NADH-quinone oxidoreductase subunit M [Polyangium sp.]
MPSLLLTIFPPLLGAFFVILLPPGNVRWIKGVALFHAALAFIASWSLVPSFDRTTSALQFVAPFPWSPDADGAAALGVDGISFPMVLLTTLVMLIALVASLHNTHRVKGYFAWFLLLEFAVLGVFTSLSWSLFYVFWELTLVPLFFLVSVWGGKNRSAASMSFFLYTLAGSVLMLVAILALHLSVPKHGFGMVEMQNASAGLGRATQVLLFLGLFAGLAVKIPVFPLHGWLPLAYVESEPPVSMVFSAVLAKMGAYGLLRLTALLPAGAESLVPLLFLLGLVNIVYGALLAFRQPDLKTMVAYGSMSHMGFVLIGVSSLNDAGLTGATMQMCTHGVSSAALFLLVGALERRTKTRDVRQYGGLASVTPRFFVALSLALLGSMGLPGLAGFVSELSTLVGTFQRYEYFAGIATVGVLITAGYSIRAIGRLFFGPLNPRWKHLRDLEPRELVAAAPLGLLIVALGVAPRAALDLVAATVSHMATLFHG